MDTSDALDLFPIELAHRAEDGIDVWLYWQRATNRVFVAVWDLRTGESFRLDVGGACALDAFHHPYAYAARWGVTPVAVLRENVDARHPAALGADAERP